MATMALFRVGEGTNGQASVLSDLYTQRNSLPLISRLPNEILSTIFILCAHDHHYENRGYGTQSVPTWINVSYVCRHWRDVALNCPTLWTYVFSTESRRWTQELFTRSKQASLKIHLNLEQYSRKEPLPASYFVEQVMDHVDRIQELHLELGTYSKFLSKLSSYAPRLQNLKISTKLIMDDASSVEWPAVLFQGDTPALRTVKLFRCPVPWHTLMLSGLTTLSLHYVPDPFQQNIVEFLAVLSCMQDLVHLYLEEVLASARDFLSSGAFKATPKANLSRLSRLLITAPLSTIVAFLSCVDVPLKTELRLKCQSEDDSPADDYIQLSSLLIQRFSTSDNLALACPTVRSLVIDTYLPEIGLIFSASERECHPFRSHILAQWGHNIPVTVDFDCMTSIAPSDRERIISDICCSIPSTSVQSLHFIHPRFSLDFWRKLLGHLRSLRHIKLSRGRLPDIVSILSSYDSMENHSGRSDGGSNQIFAPALEELELQDVKFLERRRVGGRSVAGPAFDPQSLCDALSTRKEPRCRLTIT